MQLDQLKVLDAIVKAGSFRAAAEALHRAQSAVSYAIRNLESDLNVQLFSRDSYRPVLTPEGRAVHAKAQALLAGADELTQLGKHLAQGWEPVVRLAVTALFPLQGITALLREFSDLAPQTRVQLSIEVLAGAAKVESGDAELAISELIDTATPGDIETVQGGGAAMLPVVAPSHPLAAQQGTVERSELLRHVHVILSSNNPGATEGRTAGILAGASTWSTSELSAKKTLLLAGLGWGLMPEHLVAAELEAGTLRVLDVPEYRDFHTDFYLLRHRTTAPGKGAALLWDLMRKHCGGAAGG